MKKEFVSGWEYSQLLEATKYCDDTRYDVNKIIEIFEYLKDKETDECRYDGKKIKLENAHLDFLKVALGRAYFSSKYSQGTEGFLKSDYLAEELKKEILSVLSSDYCSLQLMELLSSERKMKDFSKEEIQAIEDSLHKTYEALPDDEKKRKCGEILDFFEDYFFVIDGKGPVEYIKEKSGSKLPIIMLEKSGVISHPSYYSGYGVDSSCLGEEHLFSLYKKFVQYYPNKAEEFVKMVRAVSRLTATEFVTNYLSFVTRGLDSNFNNKKGNLSVEGVHGATRDLVGAVSMFSLFSSEQSDLDKSFKLDEHFAIKKRFAQMIEQFKKTQESEQSKTNENDNVKKLGSKI